MGLNNHQLCNESASSDASKENVVVLTTGQKNCTLMTHVTFPLVYSEMKLRSNSEEDAAFDLAGWGNQKNVGIVRRKKVLTFKWMILSPSSVHAQYYSVWYRVVNGGGGGKSFSWIMDFGFQNQNDWTALGCWVFINVLQ